MKMIEFLWELLLGNSYFVKEVIFLKLVTTLQLLIYLNNNFQAAQLWAHRLTQVLLKQMPRHNRNKQVVGRLSNLDKSNEQNVCQCPSLLFTIQQRLSQFWLNDRFQNTCQYTVDSFTIQMGTKNRTGQARPL